MRGVDSPSGGDARSRSAAVKKLLGKWNAERLKEHVHLIFHEDFGIGHVGIEVRLLCGVVERS